MEFLPPISIPKPLAPSMIKIFKKQTLLFKLIFEIRFSDALFAADVILIISFFLRMIQGCTSRRRNAPTLQNLSKLFKKYKKYVN